MFHKETSFRNILEYLYVRNKHFIAQHENKQNETTI